MAAPDPTTIGMFVSAIGGLSGVIGILWKQVKSHFADIEKKLDLSEQRYLDCEQDRLRIWQRLAEQSGKDVQDLKSDTE